MTSTTTESLPFLREENKNDDDTTQSDDLHRGIGEEKDKNTMKYVITVSCHLTFAIVCANRSTLSMTIMSISKVGDGPEWTSEQKGIILSAFFWSYVLNMIPSGIMVTIKSPTKLIFFGGIVNSSLTLLSPYIAMNFGYDYFLVIRLCIGLVESMVAPAIFAIIQNWYTKYTKTRMTSIAGGGCNLGYLLSFPFNGILIDNFGWKMPYYLFGIIGLLWSIIWYIVVTDKPEKNRFISNVELHNILRENNRSEDIKFTDIPLKAILKSSEIWIIAVTHFCENWNHYVIVLNLPMFLNNCLDFNILNSSFLSLLPNTIYYIFIILSGFIVDYLLRNNILQVGHSRKLVTCLGLGAESIFFLLSTQSENPLYIICYISIGYGLAGMTYSGFRTEIVEISKPYCGYVFSIINTISNIPGIISPTIIGVLTTNNTRQDWNQVFYIAVAISAIGCIVYGRFASNKVQHWAKA